MWVHHPPPTHPEHAQQHGGAQSSARSSGLHSRGLRGLLNLPHTALEGEAAGSRGGRPVFPDGKLSFLSFRGQRIISVTLKRSQGRCGLERDMDSTVSPRPQGPRLQRCTVGPCWPSGCTSRQSEALPEAGVVSGGRPSSHQQEARGGAAGFFILLLRHTRPAWQHHASGGHSPTAPEPSPAVQGGNSQSVQGEAASLLHSGQEDGEAAWATSGERCPGSALLSSVLEAA